MYKKSFGSNSQGSRFSRTSRTSGNRGFNRSIENERGESRYGVTTPRGTGSTSSRPSRGSSSFGPRSFGSSRSGGSYGAPRGGSSYGGRPARSGGFSSGPKRSFGGGTPRRRGGPKGQYIDPSRFINKVVVTEEIDTFVPTHKFQDFAFEESLKQSIIKKGYTLPTPIQDMAIPHVLRGADVVGIANTGTGKTATFLLPLINKVLIDNKSEILIIVPTRELAVQIDDELRGFIAGMKIYSATCFGGAHIGPQIRNLRYLNNFVIGTPGRLKDLIERKVINLANYKTIVLDEADRMLDMGFVNDMRYVVSLLPKERQGLFFSATMSPEIDKLINEFLKEPVRISVKTRDTSKNVEQDVIRIENGKNKIDVLHDLLATPEFHKVLIFGRTKHGVDKLAHALSDRGFKVESIHGNKNQSKRQKALNLFKGNGVQALIATDVAARGLDIDNVSHVINFDIPETYDDYIHRIGRTGRGNKKGKAITFIE